LWTGRILAPEGGTSKARGVQFYMLSSIWYGASAAFVPRKMKKKTHFLNICLKILSVNEAAFNFPCANKTTRKMNNNHIK
jgi:hypothetical protein